MLRKSITPTTLVAECEACDFKANTGRYDADRMGARRHAMATGHAVRVETTRSFRYAASSKEKTHASQ